jgi:putative nucleotidyltransferase with HDIG domain
MKILKIIRKKTKIKINKDIILRLSLILIFFAFLFNSLLPPFIFVRKGIKLNRDLISPKNIEIIDEEKTKIEIENALKNTPIYYEYNPEVEKEILKTLNDIIFYFENFRKNDEDALKTLFEKYGITIDFIFQKNIKTMTNQQFINFTNILKETVLNLLQEGIKEDDFKNIETRINYLLKNINLSEIEKDYLDEIIKRIIKPNLLINEDLTNKKREEIIKSIKPVLITIKKGDVIFQKGTVISDDEIKILKNYGLIFSLKDFIILIFIFFFSIILSHLIYSILNSNRFIGLKEKIFIILIIFISLIIGKLIKLENLLPIYLISNLTILFFDILISFATIIPILFFYSLFFSDKTLYIIILFFVSTIFSLKTKKIVNITDFLKIGSYTGFTFLFVYILFEFINKNFNINSYLLNSIFVILNPIISILILLIVVPYLEKVLSVTTPIGLVELLNINNPILKEFIERAPGSYQHSLNVSTLAQVAADSIGEDALLAKVCAYYHDIGKMNRPEFFIENNPHINPHDSISPSLSALIIISHVKDGVEIAKKYNLPKIIIDTIKEHHGTTLVTYFYSKAKTQDPNIDESTFRYGGPIPSSKISGIIMLADSIEASVRGEKINVDNYADFVNDIIDSKISDGQLDNSNLSFKDILKIKEAFIKTLTSIYHERISYVIQSGDIREKK